MNSIGYLDGYRAKTATDPRKRPSKMDLLEFAEQAPKTAPTRAAFGADTKQLLHRQKLLADAVATAPELHKTYTEGTPGRLRTPEYVRNILPNPAAQTWMSPEAAQRFEQAVNTARNSRFPANFVRLPPAAMSNSSWDADTRTMRYAPTEPHAYHEAAHLMQSTVGAKQRVIPDLTAAAPSQLKGVVHGEMRDIAEGEAIPMAAEMSIRRDQPGIPSNPEIRQARKYLPFTGNYVKDMQMLRDTAAAIFSRRNPGQNPAEIQRNTQELLNSADPDSLEHTRLPIPSEVVPGQTAPDRDRGFQYRGIPAVLPENMKKAFESWLQYRTRTK